MRSKLKCFDCDTDMILKTKGNFPRFNSQKRNFYKMWYLICPICHFSVEIVL